MSRLTTATKLIGTRVSGRTLEAGAGLTEAAQADTPSTHQPDRAPQPGLFSDGDRFIDSDEYAALLGISKSKANKDRLTGDCAPFFKIGSRVVYKRSEVLAWMEKRRRRSTSDAGEGARVSCRV